MGETRSVFKRFQYLWTTKFIAKQFSDHIQFLTEVLKNVLFCRGLLRFNCLFGPFGSTVSKFEERTSNNIKCLIQHRLMPFRFSYCLSWKNAWYSDGNDYFDHTLWHLLKRLLAHFTSLAVHVIQNEFFHFCLMSDSIHRSLVFLTQRSTDWESRAPTN